MWLKSSSHYKVPIQLIIASIAAIALMGYVRGGESGAESLVEVSLRHVLFQWPIGLVIIFLATRIFQFDFGTFGTVSLKILAISFLTLTATIALYLFAGVPFSSIISLAVSFVIFLFSVMLLFETSGLETWGIAALTVAVSYGLNHYVIPAVQQSQKPQQQPARKSRRTAQTSQPIFKPDHAQS